MFLKKYRVKLKNSGLSFRRFEKIKVAAAGRFDISDNINRPVQQRMFFYNTIEPYEIKIERK